MVADASALHSAKAAGRQGAWSWTGSPSLAKPLLYRAGALLPARRQSLGNHQSPTRSKPLTGEPCAGDLHARFGGGSGANQCAVPTSILSCTRRALTIHADGDKWADRGGRAVTQGGWASRPPEFKTPGRADPPWSAHLSPSARGRNGTANHAKGRERKVGPPRRAPPSP